MRDGMLEASVHCIPIIHHWSCQFLLFFINFISIKGNLHLLPSNVLLPDITARCTTVQFIGSSCVLSHNNALMQWLESWLPGVTFFFFSLIKTYHAVPFVFDRINQMSKLLQWFTYHLLIVSLGTSNAFKSKSFKTLCEGTLSAAQFWNKKGV